MRYEDILADKLEQLDYIYSVRVNLLAKIDVLGEMLELARRAGVEVISREEWIDFATKALAASGYNPQGEAKVRVAMNEIKAKLLKECVERGLIRAIKEIPIAGLEEVD